jgi:hypothetical protein
MNTSKDQSKEGMIPPMRSAGAPRLTFGIYQNGTLGTDVGIISGKPNENFCIQEMLSKLQHHNSPFIVRCYLHYDDSSQNLDRPVSQPEDFLRYI